MRFGQMDRRIVIERAALTTNTYGERAETWGTYTTVWAEISYKYGSGSESIQSDQILTKQPVSFIIRYSATTSGITPTDRVSYGGDLYQIEAIQEIGRAAGLRIVTTLRGE